jgi:glycolate oxidase
VRYRKLSPDIVEKLKKIVGKENVRLDEDYLKKYSHDETSEIEPSKPEVVVFPRNTEQVSKIMKLANENMIPVTPRGAGTGLSGGAVPIYGGIVLSLELMNRILEFDPVNMTVTVEPGVITDEIQKLAEEHGLYYAGDPASSESSSIGGNIAENAGGTRVIKYGPTGYHVLGLEVVTPTGEVVKYGGKMVKNVMGYDMVHLIIGSEGTLGMVTKAILRLIPKPKYFATLLVPFKTLKSSIESVPKVIPILGLLPSSVEFMDRKSVEMSHRFLNETIPNMGSPAHLIIEIDSPEKESLVKQYMKLGDELMKLGAIEVYVADNRHQKLRIWKFRKAIAEGIIAFRPVHCMEDVSVPISGMPNVIKRSYEIAEKHGLEVLVFGHVGDGNLHVTFLKPDEMEEDLWKEKLEKSLRELYELSSSLGGSITGEHGVGIKRKKYLGLFMKREEIEFMKKIKKVLDPNNVLNPGKVF